MPTSRDVINRSTSGLAYNPVVVAANGTTNGNWIDMKGKSSISFVFFASSLTDGTYTPTLQESDDQSAVSSIASTHVLGSLTAIAASYTSVEFGAHTFKRYVRMRITAAGTSTGGLMGATYVAGDSV